MSVGKTLPQMVMIQSYWRWRMLRLLSVLMHMFCMHYYVLDLHVLIIHVADFGMSTTVN